MILTLEVVGEQAEDFGASGRKVFHAVGGTIGRLPDNDWVFPDPYVSGRHALIRYLGGKFFVEDTSTNGVFINSPDNRLSKAQPHPLKHGDLLYIDAYRITVSIESESGADAGTDTLSILKSKMTPKPASAPPPAPPPPVQAAAPMARTPPLPQPPVASPSKAPSRSRPPQETVMLLPDDEHTIGLSGADDQKTEWMGAAKSASVLDDQKTQWIGVDNTPVVDDKTEWFSRGGAAPAPEPSARQRVPPQRPMAVQPPTPAPAPPPPQPAAPPPPPVVSAPPKAATPPPVRSTVPLVAPAAPAPVARERAPQRIPEPTPERIPDRVPERSADRTPSRASGAAPSDDSLMRELLASAGIVGVEPSTELARTMGAILRIAVSGMMEVQRARERMKDELRVRGTIFKPAHNNPLKFSANVEDAFHNLLIKHNAAYLDPTHAFEDAFHDVRDHHAAILAALRLAFEAMLSQFDPARMQEEFDRQMKKGSILGVPVKLRYWDLYRDRYGDMVKDADTSFRHLFGDKFATEYEEQLERLKSQNRDRENK